VSDRLRTIIIAHNHPDLHPGGTEIFARSLARSFNDGGEADALFVGCVNRIHRAPKPGTLFQAAGRSGDELLFWSGHFDRFFQSRIDLHAMVPELTELLTTHRPQIVHFHHTLLIGVEAIALVRRVLPEAKILLTLHDYYAICPQDGQMVTAPDRRLCRKSSPDACRRCLPDLTEDRFTLRELHLKTLFSLIDRFVAPSEFLRQRYIDWGIAADRIVCLRNGIDPAPAAPPRPLAKGGKRDRFGFFGHLNPYKGAMVAIEAARRLAAEGRPIELALHGSADFQTDAFKAELETALAGAPVRAYGGYSREELPQLIADVDWVVVPSIWWENAPLVIQEAFRHRRPVICSNIGGMAEMVRDGIDGLHFRVGDATDLARTMARAADSKTLWGELRGKIASPRTIADAAHDHLALYRRLAGLDQQARRLRAARPVTRRNAGATARLST
jgi:glycosyltransferase involved in cell wall biosynthesis